MVGQTRSFSHRVRVATATLSLLVHGCTDVKGGAVELSWKLRAAAGAPEAFVTCNSAGELLDSNGVLLEDNVLTQIRLHWQGETGDPGSVSFQCSASHGVTTFEVTPGNTLLWVRPVCGAGAASFEPDPNDGTYVVPAPAQRTVIAGDTVSLGAVEIVLQVSECTLQTCVCQ
jgi:hypothetical protein